MKDAGEELQLKLNI